MVIANRVSPDECPYAKSQNCKEDLKNHHGWQKAKSELNNFSIYSFAEYMLVHEHAIAKIREDMPLDRAALIGCGVTTGWAR